MSRQPGRLHRFNWSGAWTLLLLAQVTAPVLAADKPTPADADQPVQVAPPHIGAKTGESWSGNNVDMEFLWVEPGSFVIGSPKDEPERSEDEDQVDVTLTRGFWLGKYEVTQEQWKNVLHTEPWIDQIRVRVALDSPAAWVSWDESQLFCREFTRQERESGALPDDWEYVLPTEAQWEYACRAGTTTKFYFGDDDARLFDYAWYGEQDREPKEMNARAVGRKPANPWGFYDMHGNVVEWTRDWYNPQYPGGVDPYVTTDFNNRVTLRGGEWRLPLRWSRSACRQNLLPSGRAATVGLRVSLQQGNTLQLAPVPTVRLAVISFENAGTSVAYQRFGSALSEMLASDLAEFAALEVLERQSPQGLTDEAALAQTGLTIGGTADRKKLAAAYVLTGTCAVNGDKLSVTARLARPGFPKPEAEWGLGGSIDDLFRLEKELTSKVVSALKIKTDKRPAPPPSPGAGPLIAIMPLANNSATARLDDMQIAFAEMLQAGLGEIEGVRLVERQELDAIMAEQSLSLSGLTDPQTALHVGNLAGAQRLLTGSFLELGKELSLQTRIVDTATGGVVGSAAATKPSDEFSELIDDVTRQIVASLAIPLPVSSDPPAVSDFVGRTLESAIHRSAGHRLRKVGNPGKAAEAYQQALLIEPHNMSDHRDLMQVQMEMKDWEGAIKTGEHALQFPTELERVKYKDSLLNPLATAYYQVGRYSAIEDLLAKYGDVSESFRFHATIRIADARIAEKRFAEGTAIVEQMAAQDVAEKGVLRSVALQREFMFHAFHSTSVVGIPIKVHQDEARKAIEIYERVLEAARNVHTDEAAAWAGVVIPAAVNLMTIGDENRQVPFLGPEQKTEYQRREIEVFGWLPDVGLNRSYELGVASESQKSWETAVEAYRQYLELSQNVSYDRVWPYYGFRDWSDKRIEAHYRIARILGFHLNRQDEARQAYETLVQEYGLSHFAGPDALVDMHKLGLHVEIPERSALVCSGATSNLNGWAIMLATQDVRMHGLRRERMMLRDLAAYRLVILNHSGDSPFLPSEILALRTFVAAGGSLLVNVSPMWRAAAPCLHNSLLSFFEIQAEEGDPISTARSTQIVPHPITVGITEFTAQQAVGLRAPDESILVRAGEKGLLAAREYGRGRVVVASIGQWYTPEILLVPEIAEAPARKVVSQGKNSENYEYIRGLNPEPPLLRQTLDWLSDPRPEDALFAEWRAEWQAAVKDFSRAQARIMPPEDRILEWDDLPAVFDRLIADAPNPELKELSLWTAGECLFEFGFFNFDAFPVGFNAQRGHLAHPWYRRAVRGLTLPAYPKYFQQLVDDFQDSPLWPYAQYRLACILHSLESRNDGQPESGEDWVTRRAKPYQNLKLQPGTHPHAWTRLEIGLLYYRIDDYEHAVPYFDQVAETMPMGAEKCVALFNVAKCRMLQTDYNEARRRLNQLGTLPPINWVDGFFLAYSDWSFHFFPKVSADSRMMSELLIDEIPKLDNNKEFQQWRAERKQQAARNRR